MKMRGFNITAMFWRVQLGLLPAVFSLASGCGGDPAGLSEAERRARVEELSEELRARHGVPSMALSEYLALPEAERPLLVDVRAAEEQAVSRIPGAIRQQDFDAASARYAGQPVLTYCTIGERSAGYTRELREAGWEAYNMPGSILAWTHAGLPLETPEGEETNRVHVYSRGWNFAADGYEGVW